MNTRSQTSSSRLQLTCGACFAARCFSLIHFQRCCVASAFSALTQSPAVMVSRPLLRAPAGGPLAAPAPSPRLTPAGGCRPRAWASRRHQRSGKALVRQQAQPEGRNDEASKSEWTEKKRRMEDELKDPRTPFEYLIPRPLRLALFGGAAGSCFIATLLGVARLSSEPSLAIADGGVKNLAIDVAGVLLFVALFMNENSSAEKRVVRRKEIRDAQIEFGDREVFVNEEGQKMSKLKQVDDDWILRRLERWGRRDQLPLVGPKKGAILQQLVEQKNPRKAVEIGSFLGYSAILIAQKLQPGASLVTIENDLKFVLTTKRFLWQASQGDANKQRDEPLGRKVSVRWGKAQDEIPKLEDQIDFLFIDGRPKEYLEYLKAAEGKLAPGATIVADNAGVFAEGGLKPYLEYVRSSPLYTTTYVESTLEWRDDVPDGLEVSTFIGTDSSDSW